MNVGLLKKLIEGLNDSVTISVELETSDGLQKLYLGEIKKEVIGEITLEVYPLDN